MKMSVERLQEILINHRRWLESEDGGARANLQGADLQGADLRGANLQGADLQGANGQKITITTAPIQISNLRWFVTIWDAHMQIGCEFHSFTDWESFDDERIKSMDPDALKFWSEWKTVLIQTCKMHGGTP